jgi:hypothetical protein
MIIQGSRFFHENSGSQFFMRGVHVHDSDRSTGSALTIVDVLSEGLLCERDIPYFLKLNINTILVEDIDITRDHSSCMDQLANAGIYVLLYFTGKSIRSVMDEHGKTFSRWDYIWYQSMERRIDEFHRYPNTLGIAYFTGTVHDITLPKAKAAIVHMKEYMRQKGYRRLPFGFEGDETRNEVDLTASSLPDFVNCGDRDSSADFYSIGLSPSCLKNSYIIRSRLTEKYSNYSIPTVLSYRCNTTDQHDFAEIPEILGEDGSKVFSGVSFQEWFDLRRGGNGSRTGMSSCTLIYCIIGTYSIAGLVDIKGNNVLPNAGFFALSSRFGAIKSSSSKMQDYIPTEAALPLCNKIIINNVRYADHNGTFNEEIAPKFPGKPYQRLCSCMMETLHCTLNNKTSPATAKKKFNEICEDNVDNCRAINFRAKQGEFGSYAGCVQQERVSWQFNQNFVKGTWNATDCISSGGEVQTPSPTEETSECGVLLRQAGPEGTGTITYTPTTSAELIKNHEIRGNSLTKSQQIGISVGLLFTIILLTAFLFLWRYRRTKKIRPLEVSEFEKSELPDNSIERQVKIDIHPANLDADCELDGNEKLELAASVPHELEGAGQSDLGVLVPQEIEGNQKHELAGNCSVHEDVVHELPASPIAQQSRYSFNSQVDTIIKS